MQNSEFQSLSNAEILTARSRLLQRLRDYFQRLEFIEVQPPVLCSEFVIDRHIDPIELRMTHPATHAETNWYLQSSPEAAMKRLLADTGLQRIYSIGPVFRLGESGTWHNPEFTMAEWYRVGDDLHSACSLLDALMQSLLGCDAAIHIRFADAFSEYTGVDLFTASTKTLAAIADQFELGVAADYSQDWDDWVNLIFSFVLQPRLGIDAPTMITHFPASQAALARLSADDVRTAERFEYFYQGVELANGYCELVDADELRRRCSVENGLRASDGKLPLPIPERLLSAMQSGLPAMSGCALGFDRVVALHTGSNSIKSVIVYPTDRA
jgi:lysyl-tRNA synthetase class 2